MNLNHDYQNESEATETGAGLGEEDITDTISNDNNETVSSRNNHDNSENIWMNRRTEKNYLEEIIHSQNKVLQQLADKIEKQNEILIELVATIKNDRIKKIKPDFNFRKPPIPLKTTDQLYLMENKFADCRFKEQMV